MKPTQLSTFLATALKARKKVLIKGKPGVGKSDLVAAACAAAGFTLYIGHPAVSDPTDFKGMPAVTHGGTQAHFLPFGDLQLLIDATVDTAYFLDDLGQAPHSVQAAVMQLILARRVNGHKISDKVVFIGATNDSSHRAGVQSILEPVKSRWHTIVELEPSEDDWLAWAVASGMPESVCGFIRWRPALLCDFTPTRELTNSPSPRTWAAVGEWLLAGVTDLEVLAGAVGAGAAAEFLGFLRVYEKIPTIAQILANPATAPVPTEPSELFAVGSLLVRKFTPENARACFTYAQRLPKEHEVCLVRDAQRVHEKLRVTKEMTEWAIRNAGVW